MEPTARAARPGDVTGAAVAHAADRPVLRSRAGALAAVLLALLALVMLTTGAEPRALAVSGAGAVALAAAAVIVWALLYSRRQRRAHEDALTVWAAERAAQAERLRIARDLHDLASHGLGLITVRAAAARTTAPGPGGEAERARALADIERAGREATAELRRMLTVLRTPGEESEPARLRPAETLRDLPALVSAARDGGVSAALDLGEAGAVSAGAQLTVCAVVREGLANTARHAGPVAARVTVRHEGGTVAVTVEDDGPAPGWRPQPGTGQGLTGLRERLALLGGALAAGPRSSGPGFRLTATVPDGGDR
ncbi:Signal transduction histidine kinase [Nocardiopsis flavescens]|uniref:histidine kinase n=1 Tax=Nocardiopsis flavescens TaxID=758803 RepID=A0A1M6NQ58_9ACTN|nr:histidine kinase [Nocardiopsis flavescens]SHJ97746.1 Signal transduction histidine kinase [Nocardiopsis flavescens]